MPEGRKALDLSRKVYAATGMTEHGFLVTLALVELGRCPEALKMGNELVTRAKQEKKERLAAGLQLQVESFAKPDGCKASGR